MILVDTSIWVDHLRSSDASLVAMLERGLVRTHPFVIGEIALGHLAQRAHILGALRQLPRIATATNDEVLFLIERHSLAGLGIGLVDVHLLASTLITAGASLWSRDRRLQQASIRLNVAFTAPRT